MEFVIYPVLIFVLAHGQVSAQEQFSVQKCALENTTCQGEAIASMARYVVSNGGYQPFNISSIEPQYLEPTSQQVMDFINLTLHAGECLNIINTCRIRSFEMDIKNMRRRLDFNCANITIQGIYSLATNPVFAKILGDITGCGNLTIILEDWSFYFDYEFSFEKRNESIFLKLHDRDGIYRSTVDTKAIFRADLIKLDKKDITKKVLSFMNKNWKDIIETFGGFLKEQAKMYYDVVYRNLFSRLPATEFFTDDLEPYLKSCSQ